MRWCRKTNSESFSTRSGGKPKNSRSFFDVEKLRSRQSDLEKTMNDQEFWQDQKRSEETLREISTIKSRLEPVERVDAALNEGEELIALAIETGDSSVFDELMKDLLMCERELKDLELALLFSDPDDQRNVILSIHPGAGGTESMDWAGMLLRMYTRFCEDKGFDARILELSPGEEAGIKSVSVEVKGVNAYGTLKSESGVHRLVRLSPFDASHRRHTSFASVFVYPEIENNIEVEIQDDDLKIDTFRASGAGGQHVNKTDSAVRITHLPTGIVVQCQSERSQHRNRENAMKILRARLYHVKMEEEREKLSKMMESQKDIAWGSQIRSYVLHPYSMVKDHRTTVQTSDTQGVLDGDLDEFIEAYLHKYSNQS
ncbi:MAG: peptide chain release factor 2 [Candidatus Latescibacterota bacterium]|nr:MAG: peptide chain release factor 2 [Candidatus Latescibacterota bacterium]